MEKVWSFVLAGATVVMTVATVLLGIALPSMWGLSKDIGLLTGKVEEFTKRVDERYQQVYKRLEWLDTKADSTIKRIEAVDLRLAQRDSDPAALVAQAGFRPDSEFTGVRGKRSTSFPKRIEPKP